MQERTATDGLIVGSNEAQPITFSLFNKLKQI